MKTNLLFICSMLFSFYSEAQNLPNPAFLNHITIPCPNNPGVNIQTYAEWEAYQTDNDMWWGSRDTTKCINLWDPTSTFGARINPAEIDVSKPVFIRSKLDSTTVVNMWTDWIYDSAFSTFLIGGASADLNQNCSGGLCSKLIVGIRIPDSTGTTTAMRYHEIGVDNTGSVRFCLPTEKFAIQDIREYIYQFKFDAAPLGSFLKIIYSNQQFVFNLVPITGLTVPGSTGNYLLDLSIWAPPVWDIGLVMHQGSSYPGPANISYAEITPDPNPTSPETLTVRVNYPLSVTFQPYTSFRPALVSGSTTQRHFFNFINNGADFCLNFIDIAFHKGDRFEYSAGNIEFGSMQSCMLFTSGSSLNVSENAVLYYGQPGKGMLAMKPGSKIKLGTNAKLIIGNTMMIYRTETDPDGSIDIELKPGNSLRFAPGSSLKNSFSFFPDVTLNVYMNGGELDDSGLSDEDKKRIRRIYSENNSAGSGFTIYPNPARDIVFIKKGSDQEDVKMIRLFDIHGREVSLSSNGEEQLMIKIPQGLSSGIYTLKIDTDKRMITRKLIINR